MKQLLSICLSSFIILSNALALVTTSEVEKFDKTEDRIAYLKDNAKAVFLARAETITPFKREGGIFTRIEFSIERIYKGSIPSPLVLEFYGGCIDGEASFLDGVPQFDEFGTYVLFLSNVESKLNPLLEAGVISVDSDQKVALPVVLDGGNGVRLIQLSEFEEYFLKIPPCPDQVEPSSEKEDAAFLPSSELHVLIEDEAFSENEFGGF